MHQATKQPQFTTLNLQLQPCAINKTNNPPSRCASCVSSRRSHPPVPWCLGSQLVSVRKHFFHTLVCTYCAGPAGARWWTQTVWSGKISVGASVSAAHGQRTPREGRASCREHREQQQVCGVRRRAGTPGPNRALEVHVPVIPARQCGARAWLWVSPAQLSGCSRFKGEIERAVSPTSGGTATPHHPHHHPPACPVDCAPQERNRQRPHAHSRRTAAGSGR